MVEDLRLRHQVACAEGADEHFGRRYLGQHAAVQSVLDLGVTGRENSKQPLTGRGAGGAGEIFMSILYRQLFCVLIDYWLYCANDDRARATILQRDDESFAEGG